MRSSSAYAASASFIAPAFLAAKAISASGPIKSPNSNVGFLDNYACNLICSFCRSAW